MPTLKLAPKQVGFDFKSAVNNSLLLRIDIYWR